MKPKIFWIGLITLTIGITLSVYGYSIIEAIGPGWYFPDFQQKHQIAQIAKAVGIGLIVLGIGTIIYGILVKSESI